MKYIFKYEFKVNDMEIITFDENVNETTIYQNKRYISSCKPIGDYLSIHFLS